MRMSRLSLVGVVILVLLGGTSTAVLAQDEADQSPTAWYVTGGEAASGPDHGPYREKEMEWSDPRLPARMLYDFIIDDHMASHPDGLAMAGRMTRSYRLQGLEGAWTGTGRILGWGMRPASGEEHLDTWVELVTLSGEEAYEDLSATLVRVIHGDDIGPYEGFIFEGGQPPYPDPIESPAE